MRRLFFSLVFVIFVLLLVSCDVADVKISFSKDVSEVESVEIYKLEKEYQTYESDMWGDVHKLREENTPVCILTGAQVGEFLCKISSLDFTEERIYFPAPVDWVYLYRGYVISIVYSDKSYDIIGDMGQLYSENSGDGKCRYGHADYCGDLPWNEIIESYIKD